MAWMYSTMDGPSHIAAALFRVGKNHSAPDVGQSDINYSQHYTTVIVADMQCGWWVGELLLEMSDRNCAHLLILLSVGDACPIIHCGQIQISFHQGMGSTILFFEWVDNAQEFIKQCGIYNLISPTMKEISVKHYLLESSLFGVNLCYQLKVKVRYNQDTIS